MVHKQNGGALLTALFIMTLVAIASTAMTMRLQTDIYRTHLVLAHDKMYLASQAVSFWGMNELSMPKNNFYHTKANGMVAEFPSSLGTLIPGITITGGMYDLQGLFNLNSIVDRKYLISFMNLITLSAPDMNRNHASGIGLALLDWLNPYDPSHGKDSFISYYTAQKPPYYPSHQLMQSVSELRLVKDVTRTSFLALLPYITVLPEITPININTASKKVLQSLLIGEPESRIDEALQLRGEAGISSANDLNEFVQKTNIPQQQITIESKYFMTIAQVTMDKDELTVYTILKRERDKEQKLFVNMVRVVKTG